MGSSEIPSPRIRKGSKSKPERRRATKVKKVGYITGNFRISVSFKDFMYSIKRHLVALLSFSDFHVSVIISGPLCRPYCM